MLAWVSAVYIEQCYIKETDVVLVEPRMRVLYDIVGPNQLFHLLPSLSGY